MASFPVTRLRRLRRSAALRRMVRETSLKASDLIYPVFACPGHDVAQEVESMPGVFRFSVDRLLKDTEGTVASGIPAMLLFGIPETKDDAGSGAYARDGIVQQALKALKREFPDLVLITDVCLCEYTSHGHCGLIGRETVMNDPTLELLANTALSHCEAGADMVAPSDMMDGRVQAIRGKIDAHGFEMIPIMSYAAKYASGYYGPFREAAGSSPQFGDRKGYQMDPANAREAMREVELDIEEGADIVMVKPALAYLDIVRMVKDSFDLPVAAYNVSGEYAMIKAAARQGWLDERRVVMETLTAMKRAGADLILTYFARDAARWLEEGLEEQDHPGPSVCLKTY